MFGPRPRLNGRPGSPTDSATRRKRFFLVNPRSLAGWQNRAHVLAERLGRTREAIAALDRVLALHPEQVPALAARGVLHARLGRRTEALRDAKAALSRDGHNPGQDDPFQRRVAAIHRRPPLVALLRIPALRRLNASGRGRRADFLGHGGRDGTRPSQAPGTNNSLC